MFFNRYEVNSNFKNNLKVVLCGGGKPQPDTSKYGEDKHGRDIPFLENYAKERWESVLYYMTGSTTEGGMIYKSKSLRVIKIHNTSLLVTLC